MKPKRVVLRELARADIEEAVDFYARGAGRGVADRFVSALGRTLRSIGRHPASGSPRYGFELDLPGLRSKLLTRFPYLVFYVERADHVDVWRVLHGRREIPKWMSEGDAPL